MKLPTFTASLRRSSHVPRNAPVTVDFSRSGIGVGTWADFQMPVTIVPLCALAAAVVELMLKAERPLLRRYLLAILLVGSLTILSEFFPVLTMRASPPPLCSLPGTWQQQTGLRTPMTTYLVPASALSVRPAEIVDPHRDPTRCWSRGWITPAWIG